MPWRRVIADEAQQIANAQTLVSSALLSLRAQSRWALTGTPGQRPSDLWTLLRFAQAAQTGSDHQLTPLLQECMLRRTRLQLQMASAVPEQWHVQFHSPAERQLYWAYASYAQHARKHRLHPVPLLVQWLRQLCVAPALMRQLALPPWLLLRNYEGQVLTRGPLADYMANLPPHGYYSHQAPWERTADAVEWTWDPPVANQVDHYGLVAREFVRTGQPTRAMVEDMRYSVEETMQSLRHVMEHTLDMRAPSTKQRAVLRLIRETPYQDKLVGFCVSVRALENLAELLRTRGCQVRVISGRQSEQQNEAELCAFYSDVPSAESPCLLLCSLKLGYAGLNLACARVVFFYDLWWNPAVHRQAAHRLQRLCQLHPVRVVYLIVRHSVEMYQMYLLARKQQLLEQVLAQDGLQDAVDAPDEMADDVTLIEMPLSKQERSELFLYTVAHSLDGYPSPSTNEK